MAFAIEWGIDPNVRWTTADKRSTLATKEESERLGISVGCTVVRIVRVRHTRGHNDLVEATLVPAGISPRLIASGIAEERLSIVPAPEWVAELLDVAPSLPVLKLDRLVRTRSGGPLEWRLIFTQASGSPGMPTLRRKRRPQSC